jgi:hypothetical protein
MRRSIHQAGGPISQFSSSVCRKVELGLPIFPAFQRLIAAGAMLKIKIKYGKLADWTKCWRNREEVWIEALRLVKEIRGFARKRGLGAYCRGLRRLLSDVTRARGRILVG